VTAEASVSRRVPACVPDDVLRVCWSSTLEAAAAQEGISAMVDAQQCTAERGVQISEILVHCQAVIPFLIPPAA